MSPTSEPRHTDTSEKGLEALIVESLISEAGYVPGKPGDFDREQTLKQLRADFMPWQAKLKPLALVHRVATEPAQQVLIKDRLTRSGRWNEKMDYIGTGLTGRTLGSIGIGNIGAELFRIAKPLEMRCIAHDPVADPAFAASLGVTLVDMDTLFRESDFLTVNCPLNEHTRGLVDARLIGLMKRSAYLVNTARGPIVDEKALYTALSSGKIAGAGLDVFEQEPTPADNPILKLDNVVVTPHGICFTDECMRGLAESAFRAALDVAAGREPPYIVNREALAVRR